SCRGDDPRPLVVARPRLVGRSTGGRPSRPGRATNDVADRRTVGPEPVHVAALATTPVVVEGFEGPRWEHVGDLAPRCPAEHPVAAHAAGAWGQVLLEVVALDEFVELLVGIVGSGAVAALDHA